jgi:hypothetical protein
MNRTTTPFSGHSHPPAPETPWGPAQSATEYGPGVTFYTTASHGGFHLTEEALARMPKPLDALGTWAGPGWYEEDCDWVLVAIAFPDLFSDDELFSAVRQAMNPPSYMKGVDAWLAKPEAKPIRDRCDAFYAANKDKFRTAGASTHGELWHTRAVTLARDRALLLESKSYLIFDGPFTREQAEAAGAKVLDDKRKEDVAT